MLSAARLRTPDQTVALIKPYFARLGITRVARQTGLDRVGIPCFAAIRPNSLSLAVHYGKGLTESAARAAAVMEAVEFAIAEDPSTPQRVATMRYLRDNGGRAEACSVLLPGGRALDADFELIWLEGYHLPSHTPVFVPADAVVLGEVIPRLTEIAKSTNGLASGNDVNEATLHGLCELIERDALTIWSLQDVETARVRQFSPAALGSELVDQLEEQVCEVGLELRLYDLTTDLRIPVVHALIRDRASAGDSLFSISAGASCRPDAIQAALGAITEAAQSRLTNIAGARDDYSPGEYQMHLPADLLQLVNEAPLAGPLPQSLETTAGSTAELVEAVLDALAAGGVDDIIAVDLGGKEMGVSVVRVLSAKLEDCLGNANWRPGIRAFRALAGVSAK